MSFSITEFVWNGSLWIAPDFLNRKTHRICVESRLCKVFLGLTLLAPLFVGCGGPATPTAGGPPPPAPSLIGAYHFDIPESSRLSSITVVFSGQLNPGTATTPETKFSTSQTAAVPIGPRKGNASFSVSGLKPGTWTVTASPNGFGAPVKCDNVVVPGSVTLSVAQGEQRCSR